MRSFHWRKVHHSMECLLFPWPAVPVWPVGHAAAQILQRTWNRKASMCSPRWMVMGRSHLLIRSHCRVGFNWCLLRGHKNSVYDRIPLLEKVTEQKTEESQENLWWSDFSGRHWGPTSSSRCLSICPCDRVCKQVSCSSLAHCFLFLFVKI